MTANTWYNGMVTSVYQYDPYGQVTLGSTEHTDFYRYNAESFNPNTGLEYLRARYYNADKGRFFQEDTYLGDITDPLTLNRYAYTKNSPLNYVDPSGHKISSLGDFVSFVQNKATEFRDKASSYIYEKATGALKGMLEWAKESCETLDCELVTVAYNILLGAGFALVENALNIIFSMKELGSQWDSSDSDYYQKLMEDWVLENGVTDTTYFYLGQLVSDALQTYFAVKAIPKLLTKIGPALTKLAGILGGGSGGGMVPALVGVGEYASQIGMSAEIAETLINEFGAAVAGVLIVFADITGIGHDAGKFVEALTKGDSGSWERNLKDTSELNSSDFDKLTDKGTVKVNQAGSDRPPTSKPNSFLRTENGEHVFVYDNNGDLIYDISSSRVKGFKINTNPAGEKFLSPYKLDGPVPQFILDLYGW